MHQSECKRYGGSEAVVHQGGRGGVNLFYRTLGHIFLNFLGTYVHWKSGKRGDFMAK